MHMVRRIALLVLAAAPALLAADENEDLLTAARSGDLRGVVAAINRGAGIETKTPYGQTPLYLAAMNGHEEVVKFLLDKGASVDVQDTFYKSPMLAFVIQRKHYGIARILIPKSTANPDLKLSAVVSSGRPDLVQAALETSKPGQSALNRNYELALDRKQTDIAGLLKKAGAQEPTPPVIVDPKVLESYAGTYQSNQFSIEIKVYVKDGKLTMQQSGQEFVPKARSATQFEFAPAQLQIEFDSSDSFSSTQGASTLKFKKVVPQ
jgi:ankyrin repeat protein